jgi:hypothetical protein
MNIENEKPEQTHERLLKVIADSEFKIFHDTYVFDEFPINEFPNRADLSAIAYVRDESVWSQIVPSTDSSKQLWKTIRFRFKKNSKTIGFIAWLSGYLKEKLGVGLCVICGWNSDIAGVYDYWLCPVESSKLVIEEIHNLINQGKLIS